MVRQKYLFHFNSSFIILYRLLSRSMELRKIALKGVKIYMHLPHKSYVTISDKAMEIKADTRKYITAKRAIFFVFLLQLSKIK